MILVAGGTGLLGTALCTRLTQRGSAVRVLTRDPARAGHLRASGVEIVQGDLRDVASLRRAVAGVATVVAAAHGFGADDSVSPASVDQQGNINLIDAAVAVGASIVLLSGVHASADSPLELFRAKHAAERHLVASGAPWSIVRATAFVETWAEIMGPPLRAGGATIVFGRGDNSINFVAVNDVAALVERVVLDPSLRAQTIEIGGPADLSFNQLAAMLAASLSVGGTPAARHVPRSVLRAMSVLMRPFKPSLARHAGAAVVMDTLDMTFDCGAFRTRFPELPLTEPSVALAAYATR
jgi:uncharacterized protein YbjT (DUF2867 family)